MVASAALSTEETAAWASIPTDLLLAELARRRDATATAPATVTVTETETGDGRPVCGSKARGEYDTVMHVFALILILTLSTLACGFPILSQRASRGQPRSGKVIFFSQHFGTGVLLATAFVHLIPTAFNSLTDPCLPWLFSRGYKPMAGLIAMVSALVVVGMESYLTTHGAGHSHAQHAQGWQAAREHDPDDDDEPRPESMRPSLGFAAKRASTHRPGNINLQEFGPSQGLMVGASPLLQTSPAQVTPSSATPMMPGRGKQADDYEDLELDLDELEPSPDRDDGQHGKTVCRRSQSVVPQPPSPEEQRRLMLQCLLLEAGILFHSVFIGMAVSVATGPPFLVFLIAIAFHQTFEGFALGSRIAAIHFPRHSMRPWLMVLAYGTTTPIGQAIGLAVHNLYDPRSETGLLLVGFMNAVSSGLLLFAGLVQLLAEDFLSEKSYESLRGRNRLQAYLAVIAGAGLMAGVGALA